MEKIELHFQLYVQYLISCLYRLFVNKTGSITKSPPIAILLPCPAIEPKKKILRHHPGPAVLASYTRTTCGICDLPAVTKIVALRKNPVKDCYWPLPEARPDPYTLTLREKLERN